MTIRAAGAALGALTTLVSTAAAQQHPITFGPPTAIAPELEFTRPGAALGPNGRLAISQYGDDDILLFDLAKPDTFVVIGRKGEGPGEFDGLGSFGWIDLTMWVQDYQLRRISTFDLGGKFVATLTYRSPPGSRWANYNGPELLADGVMLFAPSPSGGAAVISPQDLKMLSPVLLIQASGRSDTVAEWGMASATLIAKGDGPGFSMGLQPFWYGFHSVSSGANGSRVLAVVQDQPEAAAGSAEVRELSATGKLIFRHPLAIRPMLVTNAEWDSVITVYAKDFNGVWGTADRTRAGVRHALIRPRYHPVIARAILGRDATAWLQLDDVEGGVITWLVLSPDGKELGRAALPSNITLLDADATMAVAVRNDSDDVPHVLVMAVHGINLH